MLTTYVLKNKFRKLKNVIRIENNFDKSIVTFIAKDNINV